ncbi:MAG: NAD(P)H-dependent oxidoreductase subunit E [candidate division Zixibacteria bacterium]|nr:NAD(P)H-dependent oxidoreductase subunit E [candidate division Zixibacteria bacterium]
MAEPVKELLSGKSKNHLEKLKTLFPEKKSVVLPVIHTVYDQFGYINKDAVREAAKFMDIPYVYFEEAASFYTMFPLKPVGKYLIQACQNICCTLMGAEELVGYLKEKLNIEIGGTTDDGMFSLVLVECLGSCGTAPVMQINDKYYENLTKEKVDEILEKLRNSQ